jgi:hypothetical protein
VFISGQNGRNRPSGSNEPQYEYRYRKRLQSTDFSAENSAAAGASLGRRRRRDNRRRYGRIRSGEREAVPEGEKRAVTRVACVDRDLRHVRRPRVGKLPAEIVIAEQAVGDTVAPGARKPRDDERVLVPDLRRRDHRPAGDENDHVRNSRRRDVVDPRHRTSTRPSCYPASSARSSARDSSARGDHRHARPPTRSGLVHLCVDGRDGDETHHRHRQYSFHSTHYCFNSCTFVYRYFHTIRGVVIFEEN